MTTQADTLVRAATEVQAPIERAFEVFTQDIGSWWDTNHHILQGELAEMVFEPRTPSPVNALPGSSQERVPVAGIVVVAGDPRGWGGIDDSRVRLVVRDSACCG